MIHQLKPAQFGVSQMQISDVTVSLDESARWMATLLDESGAAVLRKDLSISGEEYDAWGSDDKFIVQKSCEILGVDLA